MRLLTTSLTFVVACSGTAPKVTKPEPAQAGNVDDWLQLKSGRTHYIAEGTGVPCLAYGIASYQPQLFSDEAKKHVRFYYVDLPHWTDHDDAATAALTYDDFVAAMDEAREALHLDHVGLCGHSMMGLFSLAYAERHPETVDWVLALGPPTTIDGLWDLEDDYFDKTASADRKKLLDDNLAAMKAEGGKPDFVRQYKAKAPMYFYDATYDPTPLYATTTMNMAVTRQMLQVLTAHDVAAELPKIQAPVFIALGGADFSVPKIMWTDEIQKRIAKLTLHVFEKSGHYVPIEERAEFDRLFLGWLPAPKH